MTLTLLASSVLTGLASAPSFAEDDFYTALTSGKVSFSARARYESVDQDGKDDAEAFTVRSVLGYKTGDFHGFKAFVEIENVSHLGSEGYNDTTNSEADYAVIADPDNTEMNQAYIQYNGFDTEARFGRQEIFYRDAPFHRFIGNVLWRQNHQSFDAFSVANTSLADTKLSYAYINKVNTIFGDDRDTPDGFIDDGKIDLHGHLVNLQYNGFDIAKLQTYGYFLDYQDKDTISSKTIGARINGGKAINDHMSVIYAAEYASQDDYKDGDMDKQDYYLAELGVKYQGWLVKVSQEMQEGDGTYSFKTPLGTNHAYQGWADLFLSTPAEGLQDSYLTVVGKVMGAKLVLAYHDFETDEGSLDAGDEFNLMLNKPINKHYSVGIAYADYNGDDEFYKPDTEKIWLFGQVKY